MNYLIFKKIADFAYEQHVLRLFPTYVCPVVILERNRACVCKKKHA